MIILTGDARQMLQTYRTYAETFRGWLLHIADEDGCLSEWCAEEFDEWSADDRRIDDTLQADILEYGSRALQQVLQREVSARTVLEGLHAAQRKLEDINGDLKVSQEIDRLLPSLKKQIAAAIQQAQVEQQRLAAPIVRYLLHWSRARIEQYCRTRGWRCEMLDLPESSHEPPAKQSTTPAHR